MTALGRYLKRIIAKHEGIEPSQVTADYIRRRRQEIYRPQIEEWERLNREADLILESLVK